MNEDPFTKRLSSETTRQLQKLYSFRINLEYITPEMPNFKIQTFEWREEWHQLWGDINNSIELLNNNHL